MVGGHLCSSDSIAQGQALGEGVFAFDSEYPCGLKSKCDERAWTGYYGLRYAIRAGRALGDLEVRGMDDDDR